MTTRQERDKNKGLQDRHQMILTQLLKDEDNKYCVDCDAKGEFRIIYKYSPDLITSKCQINNYSVL